MRHQVIQHNKFCLNKYLCTENQVEEEETMWKVYKLINLRLFNLGLRILRSSKKIEILQIGHILQYFNRNILQVA